MQLSRLVSIAEHHLDDTPCTNISISYPPSFTLFQRQALKDACQIAGLNPSTSMPPEYTEDPSAAAGPGAPPDPLTRRNVFLISETSAAALHYALYTKAVDEERHVLLFSLGASTSSASVITIHESVVEVHSATSNLSTGGANFDDALVEYVAMELKRRYSVDLKASAKSMVRLRVACERAKKALSSSQKAILELDGISSGENAETLPPTMVLQREDLERFTRDLIEEVLTPVKEAMQLSVREVQGQTVSLTIAELVLVGGATRMPGLVSAFRDIFGEAGPSPVSIRNLDEAVALGCAINSSIRSGREPKDMLLLDIVHHPIGVAILTGRDMLSLPAARPHPATSLFKPIVSHGHVVPTQKQEIFTSASSLQTGVYIQVFESHHSHGTGVHAQVAQSTSLGALQLVELSRQQFGEAGNWMPVVKVEVDVNSFGEVSVSAGDLGDWGKTQKVLNVSVGSLTPYEKDAMKRRAKAFDGEFVDQLALENGFKLDLVHIEIDRKREELRQRRNALEEYCIHITSSSAIDTLKKEVEDGLRWLEDSASADAGEQELESLLRRIVTDIEDILPAGYTIVRTGI